MSRRPKNLILCSVALALVACATSAVLVTRASLPATQVSATGKAGRGSRNLFLQPEALRVSRLLGNRLRTSSRATSVVVGNLNIAGSEQAITMIRRQAESGERVELLLGDRVLTWSAEEGIEASLSAPTDTERLLSERLIFDSPDYFVLAQLRGASYFTVARNVRPSDASEDYDGALWTIVRVDDPQSNEASRPTSPWRLYYINSQTGLIDRVVSRLGNETIEAQIVAWDEQSGEKFPSHINWSIGGQIVMSYQVTSQGSSL